MRCTQWCGSSQTSIPGMRRGLPISHVTWARLTVPTAPPTFRILWLSQLCSALPPVSQKQSHVPHTPQPSESWWVQKDTVGEGYGGNRGVLAPLTRFAAWGCRVWGPSGQAICDVDFLLGFCVSLRIWTAMGESSPSLISSSPGGLRNPEIEPRSVHCRQINTTKDYQEFLGLPRNSLNFIFVWRNWGSEKLSKMPQIMQLINGKDNLNPKNHSGIHIVFRIQTVL